MISLANSVASAGPLWRNPVLYTLDGTYLSLLLFLLCYFCVVRLGLRLIREFPLRGPYFSSLFALTLCPYLSISLIGLIKLMKTAGYARYIDNLPEQVEPLPQIFLFGLANSIVALLLYSVVYAASRKRLALQPAPQPS